MNKERIIAHGQGIAITDENSERIDKLFEEMRQRDAARPRNASRWSKFLCRLRGHVPFDASSEWMPFDYQSTSMDDGSKTDHVGARQRSAWVYCTRCGAVLKSGIEFDGFVIPGRSSVP